MKLNMKILLVLIITLFVYPLCGAQNAKDDKSNLAPKNTSSYGKYVPILLGINNEHDNLDSLKIEFVNDADSICFLHQGILNAWGMIMTDKKIRTGKYDLIIYWYENGQPKKTKKTIIIKPETEFFSLNIELANDPRRQREFNAIYLDQYTKNLDSVEFKRIWNPQIQFEKDTLLSPDYEVRNNNDSILYGAYLRFSSQLSINWVQPHNIAFMRFEQKSDSGWISIRCNAPRIAMNLAKGSIGATYKDMILGCPTNYFIPGKTYRVRIDYMINDRIIEMNEAIGAYEDNGYIGQTIHMYTDEFELK